MDKQVYELIKNKYGDRATVSEFERSLYSRDLAPVPALLVDPLFKTLPDLVVLPQDTSEIAELLKIAYEADIPVTPRAGASTVYFDSVPIKGGILMDLNLIKGIEQLDESKMTVTVKAGTTWSELDDYLNRKNYALKSFPSSAPAATIGGWFCMMGYGIGSIKYGSMLSQVKKIEVVLPDGEVKEITESTEPSIDWFVSSEGTLGIITKLELEIRALTPMKHYLIVIPEVAEMSAIISAVKDAAIVPYNLHFSDHHSTRAMNKLGFLPDDLAGQCIVGVDYEGSSNDLKKTQEIITSITSGIHNSYQLGEEIAEREWNEKFLALRLKRGGPSQLGGEVWLPVKELTGYLNDIEEMDKKYKLGLVSYGHVVTPEYATAMTMFYADETKTISYIMNLSLVKKIQDVGYRHGGYPYGIGLWNTPYLRRIFTADQIAKLRDRKSKLDNKGIMNPGKVYRTPLIMNSFNFSLGMNVMAGIRRVAGRRSQDD